MTSIVPVYYQIKQTIRDWIINKEFGFGDKIPSENELARVFNVNRLTVRQAISQLVQEGLLISKRGYGTFVTNNTQLINSLSLECTGFMDGIFYQVEKSETKSVSINKMIAPIFVREKLALDKKDVEVMQIKRVRFLSGNSFNYVINYVPLEIGERLTQEALRTKPLLLILEQDFGIQFTEAFQTIQASFADQEVAEKLRIPSGSPILFLERIMYIKKQKPIELVHISFRGDLFKYIIRLKNVRSKSGRVWVQRSE